MVRGMLGKMVSGTFRYSSHARITIFFQRLIDSTTFQKQLTVTDTISYTSKVQNCDILMAREMTQMRNQNHW